MSKSIKVKDLNNRFYLIKDIDKFIDHINKYHSCGKSIHEENGFYFLRKWTKAISMKMKNYSMTTLLLGIGNLMTKIM